MNGERTTVVQRMDSASAPPIRGTSETPSPDGRDNAARPARIEASEEGKSPHVYTA
jgi:hypothetical protein